MDGLIVVTGNKFIRGVGGRDSLVFGECVSIGIATSGDREYAVSRSDVPFHLVYVNVNVEDELGRPTVRKETRRCQRRRLTRIGRKGQMAWLGCKYEARLLRRLMLWQRRWHRCSCWR